ncbi:hypothetical protein [uncultured Chryseobacterium sp.]|uniref:hypothetical protein n=1 Tax=uncultured Chryseobacterium sp. TaxID=259322 RepID=UPI00262BC4A4|nr:hypothetical protein [uncultured Chryseobacterium sp.]
MVISADAFSQNTQQMRQSLMVQHNQQMRMEEQQRAVQFQLKNQKRMLASDENKLKLNKQYLSRIEEKAKKPEAEILAGKNKLDQTENKEKIQKEIDKKQAKLENLQKDSQAVQKEIDSLESQIAKAKKK